MRRHERALLDALDAMRSEAFEGEVWRVAWKGRDPLQGSTSAGRWSPAGEFEVLYTSLEAQGALAEIGHRLSLEPVWPSRARHDLHRIAARTRRALRFPDIQALAPFGIESGRYPAYDYAATQALASAARFLEFDSLIVPSARSPALHLVLFLEELLAPDALTLLGTEEVDWAAWRKSR